MCTICRLSDVFLGTFCYQVAVVDRTKDTYGGSCSSVRRAASANDSLQVVDVEVLRVLFCDQQLIMAWPNSTNYTGMCNEEEVFSSSILDDGTGSNVSKSVTQSWVVEVTIIWEETGMMAYIQYISMLLYI